MKNKKRIIVILASLLIVLIAVATILFINDFNNNNNSIEEADNVVVSDTVEIIETDPNRQLWLDNKSINDDYIGEIVFDSGLINKSFVQAKDVYDEDGNLYHFYDVDGNLISNTDGLNGNDVYIYTNWTDMSYDYNILGGSIFMDYRNDLDDQNIIIYGHHFSNPNNDPNKEKSFTPLELLLEEENYSDNNKLKLILDNETRSYELVGVYIFDTDDEFDLNYLQYYRTEYNYDEFSDTYDNNYYQNYIDALKNTCLYDTGVDLNTSDKTLTLQTCLGGYNGEKLQICVFKQVDIKYYEG